MKDMKKYLIALLFLSFPVVSYASFSKDLYYGVRGDAKVQALQEFLADQGHYTGAASGNFFSLTLSAVKKFQIAHNILPASGYFGPRTRAKANQVLETAGVSADSIKNEDNAPVSAPVAVPKTANDVVASLASQIALLQQQLTTFQKNQDALQQQNQSLQTIQQQQAAQTQQITQQTLQQIQQNTTPVHPSPSTPVEFNPQVTIQPGAYTSGYGTVHISIPESFYACVWDIKQNFGYYLSQAGGVIRSGESITEKLKLGEYKYDLSCTASEHTEARKTGLFKILEQGMPSCTELPNAWWCK